MGCRALEAAVGVLSLPHRAERLRTWKVGGVSPLRGRRAGPGLYKGTKLSPGTSPAQTGAKAHATTPHQSAFAEDP